MEALWHRENAGFKALARFWHAWWRGQRPQEELNVCHTYQVMDQRGWGDRDRIWADRRLDRGCRDQRVPVGRNQPYFDLQQRRVEALTIGDFRRFRATLGPPTASPGVAAEEPAATGGLECLPR